MTAPRQHTPGPWQITDEGGAIVGNEGGTLIVETGLAYWQNLAASAAQGSTLAEGHLPEVEANARLIAAAPTMFDYLTLLAARGDNEAHEIIKKITGS